IHSFTKTDGGNPNAGLFQTADGTLYGTTTSGGSGGGGNIFRLYQFPTLGGSLIGGQIQVARPAAANGFHLESRVDLTDPNGWTPAPTNAVLNGNRMLFPEPASETAKYFRLKQP